MQTILPAVALSLVVVALPESRESSGPAGSLERPFVANGRVRMNLAAGEYRITGSRDNRIRLDWSVREGAQASRLRATADVRGPEATIAIYGPDDVNVKGAIQVPERADLYVRLSAGELAVENIVGNKDLRLHAGELRVDVGRPEDYQDVRASVWVGELSAEPFNVTKGGFFRSFNWNGRGSYRLRARLKAGEIQLYSRTSN